MDQNKVKIDTLETTTKMEVLFEGLDLDAYNKTDDIPVTIANTMEDIKEEFCFLVCGHWMHGHYGHDRKDIGSTIRTFIESFKDKSKQNQPALILKSSSATFSVNDREQLLIKIEQIKSTIEGDNYPKIYLLHGDLTIDEMNGLYNHPKIKAMVSFTHGEGFGRPLLEFSITGKPVIVSGWSGHMDFMKEYGILLGGELKQLDPSSVIKDMLIPEASWFYVDLRQASSTMRDIHKNYKKYLEKTRKQTQYVKENWTLEKMTRDFVKILDDNIPQHTMEIPKLDEIQSYE
jgi:glycosyltransferase involved in cell wall biosynthesis